MTDTPTQPEPCPRCCAVPSRVFWSQNGETCHVACGTFDKERRLFCMTGPAGESEAEAISAWNSVAGMARRAAEAAVENIIEDFTRWQMFDEAKQWRERKSAIVSAALIRARKEQP